MLLLHSRSCDESWPWSTVINIRFFFSPGVLRVIAFFPHIFLTMLFSLYRGLAALLLAPNGEEISITSIQNVLHMQRSTSESPKDVLNDRKFLTVGEELAVVQRLQQHLNHVHAGYDSIYGEGGTDGFGALDSSQTTWDVKIFKENVRRGVEQIVKTVLRSSLNYITLPGSGETLPPSENKTRTPSMYAVQSDTISRMVTVLEEAYFIITNEPSLISSHRSSSTAQANPAMNQSPLSYQAYPSLQARFPTGPPTNMDKDARSKNIHFFSDGYQTNGRSYPMTTGAPFEGPTKSNAKTSSPTQDDAVQKTVMLTEALKPSKVLSRMDSKSGLRWTKTISRRKSKKALKRSISNPYLVTTTQNLDNAIDLGNLPIGHVPYDQVASGRLRSTSPILSNAQDINESSPMNSPSSRPGIPSYLLASSKDNSNTQSTPHVSFNSIDGNNARIAFASNPVPLSATLQPYTEKVPEFATTRGEESARSSADTRSLKISPSIRSKNQALPPLPSDDVFIPDSSNVSTIPETSITSIPAASSTPRRSSSYRVPVPYQTPESGGERSHEIPSSESSFSSARSPVGLTNLMNEQSRESLDSQEPKPEKPITTTLLPAVPRAQLLPWQTERSDSPEPNIQRRSIDSKSTVSPRRLDASSTHNRTPSKSSLAASSLSASPTDARYSHNSVVLTGNGMNNNSSNIDSISTVDPNTFPSPAKDEHHRSYANTSRISTVSTYIRESHNGDIITFPSATDQEIDQSDIMPGHFDAGDESGLKPGQRQSIPRKQVKPLKSHGDSLYDLYYSKTHDQDAHARRQPVTDNLKNEVHMGSRPVTNYGFTDAVKSKSRSPRIGSTSNPIWQVVAGLSDRTSIYSEMDPPNKRASGISVASRIPDSFYVGNRDMTSFSTDLEKRALFTEARSAKVDDVPMDNILIPSASEHIVHDQDDDLESLSSEGSDTELHHQPTPDPQIAASEESDPLPSTQVAPEEKGDSTSTVNGKPDSEAQNVEINDQGLPVQIVYYDDDELPEIMDKIASGSNAARIEFRRRSAYPEVQKEVGTRTSGTEDNKLRLEDDSNLSRVEQSILSLLRPTFTSLKLN